ncbi:glycosyltransferase family 2 protein [Lysobacter sp. CA199]|uniref:glycosyltransferase family 2 protein n=1 Tax=Lysobacter sp. CA199 TaxID=3455608 RepID=UPI003F8D5545
MAESRAPGRMWSQAPQGVAPVRVQVAVVIPCHRVRRHIMDVIASIPELVSRIYVVDDRCPDESGRHVEALNTDPRVSVIYNEVNLGVGGAVIAGYQRALDDGCDVIVKMDGDDQMDARALPRLIGPILRGDADYTKGNRFYDLAQINRMPRLRIFGNAMLSFMTKISSGYWDIFDPTNGYTAIHARVVAQLPLAKISRRYFFETDMLFRLNIVRAVVVDVPMDARYGDETSNLRISKILFDFMLKHVRNTGKRIFYNYFLRDLSLASIQLALGTLFIVLGAVLGLRFWYDSFATGITASAGSVMLAALQIIIGIQLVLGFLAYDIAAVPRRTLHPLLLSSEDES